MSKRCWRCRTNEDVEIHHINGHHSDNCLTNHVNLCNKCHNLIQGICDKCSFESECHIKKLQRCWGFDDALPPIYFRDKQNEVPIEGQGDDNMRHKPTTAPIKPNHGQCFLCGVNIPDPCRDDKDVICSKCVLFMVANPRIRSEGKIESLQEWAERLHL